MCAGVCPKETLEIGFNEYGEYIAKDVRGVCCDKCNLCLSVCPFSDYVEDEDSLGATRFGDVPGIKYRREVGYYLEAYVGYSKVDDHRIKGASGGLATWMLEGLLAEKLVEKVCCVRPVGKPGKLFEFVVCNSSQEVRDCSRSCYYPVETSEVIRYILSNKGQYAIIALPCYIKAFRLAMQVVPKLRQRVKFLLGLVCGQAKSKFFAEYVCALGGGNPNRLNRVVFRMKDPQRPASDYGMKFISDGGAERMHEGIVYWSEGMGRAYCERFFTPSACNYCDDTFAELADAVFMDAWLKEYINDVGGTNLLIVRDPVLQELFDKGVRNQELQLDKIAIDKVIESQQDGVRFKREKLSQRLAWALERGQQVPPKRERPAPTLNFRERYLVSAMWRATIWSKAAFLAQLRRGTGLAVFRRIMFQHRWYDYLAKIVIILLWWTKQLIRKFIKH